MPASSLRRFLGDTGGNFAIITGLCAIVLVTAAGGVVDLSLQSSAQAVAQRAADAAALAGAKALETGTLQDAKNQIEMLGRANLSPATQTVTFVPVIDEAAGTVTVTAKGAIAPSFLKLASIDSLPIEAVAKSSVQGRQSVDFYFLLDVSESMNIAASDADRSQLEYWTKVEWNQPCAFACHIGNPGQKSGFQIARAHGVRLRIDVLRDATGRMIDKILGLNTAPGSMKKTRVATNGFSTTFQAGMAASTDATKLKASIDGFTNANSHSNVNEALAQFATTLGKQGDGSGDKSPYKVALLVTDGVRDEMYPNGATWLPQQLGTVDTSKCDLIKSKGIKLAVLEVKYLRYDDPYGYFWSRVSSYYSKIPDSLKNCASPNLYYQAADADNAETAMIAITNELLTMKRRLTQ